MNYQRIFTYLPWAAVSHLSSAQLQGVPGSGTAVNLRCRAGETEAPARKWFAACHSATRWVNVGNPTHFWRLLPRHCQSACALCQFRRRKVNLVIEKLASNQHTQHFQLQSRTQAVLNAISLGDKGQRRGGISCPADNAAAWKWGRFALQLLLWDNTDWTLETKTGRLSTFTL